MSQTSPIRAYIDLTMAMILVGSSVVAGKFMIVELPPHLASAMRFLFATVLIVPLLYALEGFPKLSARSWLILFVQAICGSFLFNIFLLKGLTMTDAGAAGIITSTTPACMGIIAMTVLRERLTSRAVAGIVLSVSGIMAINLQGMSLGLGTLAGNGFILCAVLAEALFLLLRKTVHEPVSPLAISSIMSCFGLILFIPGALVEYQGFDFSAVSLATWGTVAYYGAFITVAAYLFWFSGIVQVSAGTAGVFTSIMPISAVLLSAVLLGEPITAAHVGGCALALAGIWCISIPSCKARKNC